MLIVSSLVTCREVDLALLCPVPGVGFDLLVHEAGVALQGAALEQGCEESELLGHELGRDIVRDPLAEDGHRELYTSRALSCRPGRGSRHHGPPVRRIPRRPDRRAGSETPRRIPARRSPAGPPGHGGRPAPARGSATPPRAAGSVERRISPGDVSGYIGCAFPSFSTRAAAGGRAPGCVYWVQRSPYLARQRRSSRRARWIKRAPSQAGSR